MNPSLHKANTEPGAKKSKLDNYKILRDLGEGAYGQVSLAKEIATGNLVAIKEVDMEMIVKLQKERHILREKNLLESMFGKHFNIINLLGSFKDTKNLYFVFEYGPKGTLDDLIKKCGGKIPENVVKVIFAQLINFIEFLQT